MKRKFLTPITLQFFILSLLVITTFQSQSQNWGKVSAGDDVSFEFGFGAADYNGDMNNSGGFEIFTDYSFAYSINLRKKFTPYFDVSFQYLNSNLRAKRSFPNPDTTGFMMGEAFEEMTSQVDNFTFNVYLDIAGLSYINKNSLNKRYNDSKYSLYLYTGLGISITNAEVKGTIDPERTRLIPIQTLRDEQNTFIVMPFGIGFKYFIYKAFSLGIDANYRMPFTDKLDATEFKSGNFDNFQVYTVTLGYTMRK